MFYGPVHPMVRVMQSIEENHNLDQWRDEPPRIGHGIIYAGVSPITGKVYIGQHARGQVPTAVSKSRWLIHRTGAGHCVAIQNACKKYDVQWFVIEELEDCCLNNGEQDWIRAYGTISPGGYNLTEGGSAAKRTLESIERGIVTREKTHSKDRETKRSAMSTIEQLSFDRKRASIVRSVQSSRKRRHGIAVPFIGREAQVVTGRTTTETKRQLRIEQSQDEAEAERLKLQFSQRDRSSALVKAWKRDPSMRTTHTQRAVERESLRWAELRDRRANNVLEYKKCLSCLEVKASTAFSVQKSKSGTSCFAPNCRACRALKERERREKRKLGSTK